MIDGIAAEQYGPKLSGFGATSEETCCLIKTVGKVVAVLIPQAIGIVTDGWRGFGIAVACEVVIGLGAFAYIKLRKKDDNATTDLALPLITLSNGGNGITSSSIPAIISPFQ